jgi:hypothetical protein
LKNGNGRTTTTVNVIEHTTLFAFFYPRKCVSATLNTLAASKLNKKRAQKRTEEAQPPPHPQKKEKVATENVVF